MIIALRNFDIVSRKTLLAGQVDVNNNVNLVDVSYEFYEKFQRCLRAVIFFESLKSMIYEPL